jgi:hypothetical protein
MNQTKKRLTIINLAISITDIETIQLQASKLALLKSDIKIVEILSALEEENYAQAQRLISEYIETPNETIVQRTAQDDTKEISQEDIDAKTIEEFDLFTTSTHETSEEAEEKINYDAFLDTSTEEEAPQTLKQEVDYDPLLNVEAEDVLPNNIDIDLSSQQNNEPTEDKITKPLEDNTLNVTTTEDNATTDNTSTKNDTISEEIEEENIDTPTQDEDGEIYYEAIPHINNKFNNLYAQYPPIEHTQNRYYSVENWLLQVSTKGYTETEVETLINDAEILKETNLGESAQLLIAAGATDSLYALFRLARALFIGDILQKNIPEAVSLIHYLAVNEEYPEAICDLAQLYEQGIEVEKNKKKAESLYKKAMHLGIQRATKHYQRVQKENKSLFSIFKR